jgi:hypothetical protein
MTCTPHYIMQMISMPHICQAAAPPPQTHTTHTHTHPPPHPTLRCAVPLSTPPPHTPPPTPGPQVVALPHLQHAPLVPGCRMRLIHHYGSIKQLARTRHIASHAFQVAPGRPDVGAGVACGSQQTTAAQHDNTGADCACWDQTHITPRGFDALAGVA